MDKSQVWRVIEKHAFDLQSEEAIKTAVQSLIDSLTVAKPHVTRSLPPLLQKCNDCGKEDDSVKIREDGYGLQCYKCYKSDKDFEDEYD